MFTLIKGWFWRASQSYSPVRFNRHIECVSGRQQGRGGCREGTSGAGGEAEAQQEPWGQGYGLSLRKSQGSSGRCSPLTTQSRLTHRSAHTHINAVNDYFW